MSLSTFIARQSSSPSLSSLKSQLLPALRPFQATLPVSIPESTSDFRLWVEKEPVEGADGNPGLRELETDEKSEMSKTPLQLGWGRWPKVFVR
ncbi:hypothetical protein BCR39DRAFT_557058 [Naematelia encephala]|uniref:Uncharacterized protein n=1 Tax=Naematelia encephala TaxID=71784 RepID=A0A1Y2BFN1_9TREE|nr:hypothetical protein BCR39DRAFT_557058 [Naematelia encephala]